MTMTSFQQLESLSAAKRCLGIALNEHIRLELRSRLVSGILRRTPAAARFDECRAAVWFLT